MSDRRRNLKHALKFLFRAVVGVVVAYLLWIPLSEPILILIVRSARSVLSWLSPPLITGLELSGGTVDIRGLGFPLGLEVLGLYNDFLDSSDYGVELKNYNLH